MKIKNIEELKQNINRSTILIFLVICTGAILALNFTHQKFLEKETLLNTQEIKTVGNIYKANLSEKLSIIASSNVFLDYLRSGNTTRHRLYTQFLSQLSSLESNSISGMTLSNNAHQPIFNYGHKTPYYLTLNLCYLNQTLDPIMGDCSFRWKLFFRNKDLENEILAINHKIKPCLQCRYYYLIENELFGRFPVARHYDFKFKIGIFNKKDYFFYTYFFLIILALVLFGSFSWYRLNMLLNNYITTPLKSITTALKEDSALDVTDNIEEIQYLLNEINIWKSKINKNQSDENTRKIGKMIKS